MAKYNLEIDSSEARYEPYPYQKIAINAGLLAYRRRKNGLIVIPTAGGKSLIAAEIAAAVAQFGRVLVVVPTLDLVMQNNKALRRQFPEIDVSICCAGLGHSDTSGRVVIATPGSVVSKSFTRFDAAIIDEAHKLPERKDAVLKRLIARVREQSLDAPIIGLTATPYRLKGRLDNGDIWDKIDLEITYLELLKLGVVAPLVGPLNAKLFNMDTAEISKLGGDFNEGQLAQKFNDHSTTASIASDIVRLGANRKTGLIFCVSISAAYRMRDALRERGWSCETICEKTSTEDRIKFLEDLRSGKLRAITNVATLTTGVDVPGVDLIALARPTMSAGLHVQMMGRGTRIAAKKTECLVLDFAGNISRCGPINSPIVVERNHKTEEVTHRQCASCGFYSAPRARQCESCDAEFPVVETPRKEDLLQRRADRHASPVGENALVAASSNLPSNVYRVRSVRYSVHRKPGSPDSLKVEFSVVGFRWPSVSMWLTCWHRNPHHARQRWAELVRPGATRIIPASAEEAARVADAILAKPDYVRVVPDEGGFLRVIPIAAQNGAVRA